MRPKRSYYFLAVVVPPLLFVLQNSPVSTPLHNLSLTLLKPALIAVSTVGHFGASAKDEITDFWKTFRHREVLESRISELESQLVRFQETEKENERLKKLLDFRQTISGKPIAARVIGWDPSLWRKTVVLDKGTQQGIRQDMTVVSPEGLVGQVTEAGPTTSRVLLLIDPDSRASAITDQSRAQGVAAGDGSIKLKMLYLDLDSGAQIGEQDLSSGVGGVFVKGLKIGKIVGLGKDADGLHLSAEVEPFVKFSKLEEVLCFAGSAEK